MKITEFIRRIFYTFLDISGSLLGIFLIWLGFWMRNYSLPTLISWVVLVLGVCALAIHATHYIIARKRGSSYFHTTRR
ncbi:MAG: hypothetical protein A2941_01430 [Candidatus Yanofskybacteria bacterium RIFCSPLOWO2_01_FULL_49_17]|uniref:Uncharacterized protein n=1 Tax=Candidatus Yanofskybacteria bacterium RIFCSPLOWO2_01_FULL_49_17 TaxID=1802700 RepID=A0A1F8GQG0_9BACT|nr:MAG: hypothetical protein A2941_01430 [Candidatus Yanofskybacteria bacterium RIFCSPLOWO2_01_FULL_49_17]